MTPELRPIIMRSNRMLGAALVENNLVTIDDLETANSRLFEHLNGNEPRRCSVLTILVNDLQVLKEDDLLAFLLENEGIGLIDLENFEVPADVKKLTDLGEAWATWTVPIDREDDLTLLASAHYLSTAVRAHWEKKVGGPILWYATTINQIADYLERIGKAERAMALGKFQQQIVRQLVEHHRLTTVQAEALAGKPGEMNGEEFDAYLTSEYKISPFQLLYAKGKAFGIAPVNVLRRRVGPSVFERLPLDFCQEHGVYPVGQVGGYLLVAFANPFDVGLTLKIQEMTGLKVIRMLGRERDIRDRFSANSRTTGFDDVVSKIGKEFDPGTEELVKAESVDEESGPIIQLANRIIEDAYYSGTSDIHIEPWEKEVIVRYRIDGVCVEKLRLPSKVGPALTARLKIMCNLDIAERRLPQDGRIVFKQYTRKGIDVDLRVSTAPLNHGEGVVMRILDKQKSTLPMSALGFSDENLARYREVIRQPYGMILHCGPTGSGKSMTLYSALNEINSPELVIRTAEDPIEYTLAGINQMQMHRQIGLTFATALRAFLRQDPDIILVGEIRDKETANIAVEAALTGHLLISTLHTNDAPSTVARMTDMGIEPFMISSSLLCVCAQRLMRRVCKACRVQVEPSEREKEILEKAIGWSGPIFKANARGCPQCGSSGYKGRVGIHELMTISEELVEGINKEAETAELKKIAQRGGMKTLHQDSLLKVRMGVTTMEEAIATVPPDL